ncbi:MAG: Asp-tRNA(Asn)/Glu-tRNA(Gln) amidotransferase subunit GatB, partial [Candidatus Methanomethylophilaceae archaeon]|nr:Asp-tRNA(Asn)/Glu-tRNA(Gln) amidotransferase subunit GatB [Candidatus Methanomethylophilaceae archaeon]
CNLELKSFMTGTSVESVKNASADLEVIINKFLDGNPEIVEDSRKNDKAANRVIGYVMKETGGSYSSADIVAATKKLISARF